MKKIAAAGIAAAVVVAGAAIYVVEDLIDPYPYAYSDSPAASTQSMQDE